MHTYLSLVWNKFATYVFLYLTKTAFEKMQQNQFPIVSYKSSVKQVLNNMIHNFFKEYAYLDVYLAPTYLCT